MRTLLVMAAMTVSLLPSVAHAEDPQDVATTLCYSVTRSGTLGPPLTVGPICIPITTDPANCQTTVISTTPLNVVTVYWCLPR